MAEVDPADVEALTAEGGDIELAVSIITAMARAYTRGHGFDDGEPNDELAAVITTATARFIGNPNQISMSQSSGPFTMDVRSYLAGWTLAELFVLNRYRRQAMQSRQQLALRRA
jgi:hypothetical protein